MISKAHATCDEGSGLKTCDEKVWGKKLWRKSVEQKTVKGHNDIVHGKQNDVQKHPDALVISKVHATCDEGSGLKTDPRHTKTYSLWQ